MQKRFVRRDEHESHSGYGHADDVLAAIYVYDRLAPGTTSINIGAYFELGLGTVRVDDAGLYPPFTPVSSVAIDGGTKSLAVGQSAALSATALPADASDKSLEDRQRTKGSLKMGCIMND